VLLPAEIRKHVGRLAVRENALGMSNTRVFEIADVYFLKTQKLADASGFGSLRHEAEIIEWLGQYVPVPEVIQVTSDENDEFMLMTRIKGSPASEIRGPKEQVCHAYADAIRYFHQAIPIAGCPFDARLSTLVTDAERRLVRGLVDVDDFDKERLGLSAEDVYDMIINTLPEGEDLCFTHGDYCLPNVLFSEKLDLTGFIDVGSAGIGDRHRDLALAVRSIAHNLGPEWTGSFFRRYGWDADQARIDFYQLLDEMF
jgi:kanamycin kinase/aminoglycoside 3'-phosphotransferase-2